MGLNINGSALRPVPSGPYNAITGILKSTLKYIGLWCNEIGIGGVESNPSLEMVRFLVVAL